MPSFQSRVAAQVVSAMGIGKRLQAMAESYGTDEFDDRLAKIRRTDRRKPPASVRKGRNHDIVDVSGHPLYLFTRSPDVERVVLYLHGGGYMSGPFVPEWRMAASIADRADAALAVFLYPRAPEHQVQETLAQTHAALAFLAERFPDAPLGIVGTSAGGGLAVAAMVDADANQPMPACLVLVSPAVDLELAGDVAGLEASDVLVTADYVRLSGRLYAGDFPVDDPRVSPVNADLAGLPPTQVYVGDQEILLPSAETFVDRAAAAGVEIELIVGGGQQHTYPTGPMPEARAAVRRIADFIHRHTAGDA